MRFILSLFSFLYDVLTTRPWGFCVLQRESSESSEPTPAGADDNTLEEVRSRFQALYAARGHQHAQGIAAQKLRRQETELRIAKQFFHKLRRGLRDQSLASLSSPVLQDVALRAAYLERLQRAVACATVRVNALNGREAPGQLRRDAREIFDQLWDHPMVTGLAISSSVLSIDLETIYVWHQGACYEIGDFRVVCDLEAGTFGTQCLRAMLAHHQHPFGKEGNVCFGQQARAELTYFLQTWELVSFVDLAYRMLTLPNANLMSLWTPMSPERLAAQKGEEWYAPV